MRIKARLAYLKVCEKWGGLACIENSANSLQPIKEPLEIGHVCFEAIVRNSYSVLVDEGAKEGKVPRSILDPCIHPSNRPTIHSESGPDSHDNYDEMPIT